MLFLFYIFRKGDFMPKKKFVENLICDFNVLMNDAVELSSDDYVEFSNIVKEMMHEYSPFKENPVDCVIWVKGDDVRANDYNPNKVAPPEMKLLETSIREDGYTQPIVTFPEKSKYTVIDGFHRNRVGKECKEVNEKLMGYLPVVRIKKTQEKRNHRIASTIRHNRARGKHTVDAMSEIVLELKNRNWTNSRISKELGMDEDEILRLCQITGMHELFSDEDFSKSWDIEKSTPEDIDFEIKESDIPLDEDVRTVNTSDPDRVFHTWDKWECYKAGFYSSRKEGMTKTECEQFYADFLSDTKRFKTVLKHVIKEWKYSCEHYLSNSLMNRIAWLGQAAVCYESGIPSCFCGGFNLLTERQQLKANKTALKYLNKWLKKNNREEVTLEQAMPSRQSTIY